MDGLGGGDAALSRRTLLLGLAALAALPLAGCGPADDLPALLTADGVKRVQPPGDAPVDAAVAGLTTFGHKLLVAAAGPDPNWVASPLSMAVAFAMARVGAGGRTASELDATFGFPPSGRDQAFNAITRQVVTAEVPPAPNKKPRDPGEKPKPPVLTIGNALFLQKSFKVGADFLRVLAEQYGAGVRPVDFAKDAAVSQINNWADQQTAGRIKKVFDTLDPGTKLVLANAVYFKGDWRHSFPTTGDAPFTKADGSTSAVTVMKGEQTVRYAETGGVRAVELPYAEGPYAMWVILPKPGGQPQDALSPDALSAVRAAFTETRVGLSVPKWDFESSIDLTKALRGLGLNAPFDAADFGGIADGLFISDAVHQANISVDEWGTEAAAVTDLGMAASAPPQPGVEFHVDRPYGFVIVGGTDQIPIFLGRVGDPNG